MDYSSAAVALREHSLRYPVDRPDHPVYSLLSEDDLRKLARSVKSAIPQQTSSLGTPSDDSIKALHGTLKQLLDTSASPAITAGHRVAAWNALCTYVEHCHGSQIFKVQDLVWSGGIWSGCFNLYIQHSQKARPKSSKQLLLTLSSTAKQSKYFSSGLDGLLASVVTALSCTLSDLSRLDAVKPCLQAATQFVAKDIIPLPTLAFAVHHYTVGPAKHLAEGTSFIPSLVEAALRWLSVSDYASATTQLLVSILDKADQLGYTASAAMWPSALRNALLSSSVSLDGLRAHVFPVLFARNRDEFVAFLDELKGSASGEESQSLNVRAQSSPSEAYIAALQTGKDLGLLLEGHNALVLQDSNETILDVSTIGSWLEDQDAQLRLGALSLLVYSRSLTTPFSKQTFRLLRRCLPSFNADTDPWFRGEVFGLFQRLTDRMRAATAMLSRDRSSQARQQFQLHQGFLRWLLHFLRWELRPTASYQRHACGLRCLSILARSGLDAAVPNDSLSRSAQGDTRWPTNTAIMDQSLERLLLDLLLDPFDDVRQAAASILGLFSSGSFACGRSERFDDALRRAETAMLSSGRADQADGVAHMYALKALRDSSQVTSDRLQPKSTLSDERLAPLISRLEAMLETAKRSLTAAVSKYPLHGMLTSVRYVLSQCRSTDITNEAFARLAACLQDVWLVVKTTLCNDAPEGYQAEDVEESGDMSSKDTLSYCWRALKEASLLMGALLPSTQRPKVLPSSQSSTLALSDLCFEQLAELRHRGAFSTVAQTWITCCTVTRHTAGDDAFQAYYDRTMTLLRDNVTINTRRSAGLPSLVCGILIADTSGSLVAKALADLETVARDPVDAQLAHEGSLPQVHALNCVKDILKNTRLGERSERYVPTAMQLAADSLRSEAWAVRNCGLMLFRGVLDRLLGTNDSYTEDEASNKSRPLSFAHHPQLYNTMIGLLEASIQSAEPRTRSSEGVFPALQLLQRFDVAPSRLDEVRTSVLILTASPLWHIRDKAARTYAALVSHEAAFGEVMELLSYPDPFADQNALHGRLLSAKYILASTGKGKALRDQKSDNLQEFDRRFQEVLAASSLYTANKCPLTKAAYIDVLREVSSPYWTCRAAGADSPVDEQQESSDRDVVFSTLSFCIDIFEAESLVLKDPGAAALRQSLARLCAEHLVLAPRYVQSNPDGLASGCDALLPADADALCALIDGFNRAYAVRRVESQHVNLLNIYLLANARDIKVKIAAQRGLLQARDPPVPERGSTEHSHWRVTASAALDQDSNQLFADQQLQLQTLQFEGLTEASGAQADFQKTLLKQWSGACTAAVSGQGLYSREAASQAIARLSCWELLRDSQDFDMDQVLFKLCMATYDLLNDDDEEVRLEAANTACRILPGSTARLMPLVACQRLMAFIVERWKDHARLAESAFVRAFGLGDNPINSVANRLSALGNDSTALFAEEKQNLYIDEAREVRLWAQVAICLTPRAISKHLVKLTSDRVYDGLDAMAKRVDDEVGGPLGWTAKPEAFMLGLQVIYGAGVSLSVAARGLRLPERPSTLKKKLVALVQALEKSDVNSLWMMEVRRILEDAARERVSMTAQVLRLINPASSV